MKIYLFLLFISFSTMALAQTSSDFSSTADIEELNPYDPNIEETLKEMDQSYQQETGLSPFLELPLMPPGGGCYRFSCKIYAQVVKSQQKMYLYVDGELQNSWPVSTGTFWNPTPNFDTHPDGRIYDAYTSKKHPGGNYNGLGNMPYAVFIHGGFAIHGTTRGNWPKLGSKASHGCIRVHPDNGFIFNRLVREVGVAQVWVTVQE